MRYGVWSYSHVPNSSLTHGETHANGVGSLSLALSTRDWLSFQEIGVHPRTRGYLVQQSPRLVEEKTERKVMYWALSRCSENSWMKSAWGALWACRGKDLAPQTVAILCGLTSASLQSCLWCSSNTQQPSPQQWVEDGGYVTHPTRLPEGCVASAAPAWALGIGVAESTQKEESVRTSRIGSWQLNFSRGRYKVMQHEKWI